MEFVYLFYILIAFVSGSVAERNRRCCRYSNSCTSQSSCILSDLSHPHDCLVKKDSKKDSIDPHICKTESYSSDLSLDRDIFQLKSYIYAPYNHQYYPALDLLVNYIAKWDRLRFRFMNLGGDSNPRCVDIERNSTLIFENKVESQLFLSYDCEAGFYVLGNHQLINTAGTTYQFDMCLTSNSIEKCGSYLFTMPSVEEIKKYSSSIILVQRKLLEDNFEISLLSSEKVVNVGIFLMPYEELINEYAYSSHTKGIRFPKPRGGFYKIVVSTHASKSEENKWIQIAQFRVDHSSTLYVTIIFISFVVIALGITLLCIMGKFFHMKDKYSSLSNDLLRKDKEDACDVYIISDVNHPEHSEIILHLSRYLKAQSGIDKIFYAMDPKTGITSQKNHDPWRWAMEVIENINFTKDYLVFVASPPMDTSSTLYENLSDNQTLMLTKYLSKMINANRVSKIEFPYSEPSSISSLVPKDIPKILHFAIPRQMKDFVCHIQRSSSLHLLSKLSCNILSYNIDFIDLKDFEESSELINMINNLSFKIKKMSLNKHNSRAPPTFHFEDYELRQSPFDSNLDFKSSFKESTISKSKNTGIEIEIEKNILSLKDDTTVYNRDKSINEEFN
uniref:SEFIR domain-containing protein n=1 Tax=Lepeophtheirus salmonis TaxID=72036 RepID=A0A0K2VAE5_LEPSM